MQLVNKKTQLLKLSDVAIRPNETEEKTKDM